MCYILQEPSGRVLDKWTCATREEEYVIMQQFLRFGETKSIAQEIILQDTRERQDLYIKQTSRNESEIKKFIERSNMSVQNLMRPFDVRHFFGGRLPFGSPSNRLMSPPISGFSTPTSSRELRPPLVSVTSTSPVTTSPLGRLQTMQPFDFHREASSPVPGTAGEKPRSREHSPKSESPQNLSLASTSSHSTPPHTPYTPQKMSEIEMPVTLAHLPVIPPSISLGAATMMLPTLPRQDVGSDAIINFSVKEDQDRKNKHLRKSSNPIKRNHWIPDANFGSAMIGPNGKKRVLCTACNKTFCDKGALKIHYSAVHLKEMHKCSVEGCTMMFSSRRSRNRHSANPNPKLHMPQKRPKIPEGATLIDDGSIPGNKRPLATPPNIVMAPSLSSPSPLQITDSPNHRGFYTEPVIQLPVFPSAAKRLKLDGDDEGPKDLSMPGNKHDLSRECSPKSLSLPLTPTRYEINLDNGDLDTPSKDSVDGSMSESERIDLHMSSNSPGPQRSHNRRKNIPTRCAQPSDILITNNDQPKTFDDIETNREGPREQSLLDMTKLESEKGEIVRPKVNVVEDDYDDLDQSLDRSDHKLVIDDDDDGDDEDDDEDDIDRNDTGEVLDFSMHAPDMLENENFSAGLAHDSDTSYASNDSLDLSKSNGDLPQDYEIPIDKDNPKQCVTCGKAFQNVFSLKIHYKNVHLKLMHNCTVEGCSAAFPSKRSRDRHSSNLNLHRKLLSTSDDQKNIDQTDDNQNFQANIIQKLYENHNSVAIVESTKDDAVNGNAETNMEKDQKNYQNEVTAGADVHQVHSDHDSDELALNIKDDVMSCHVCNAQLNDSFLLKEHFELEHPKETLQTALKGGDKVFQARKSRNRHGQNDALHKTNGKAITA